MMEPLLQSGTGIQSPSDVISAYLNAAGHMSSNETHQAPFIITFTSRATLHQNSVSASSWHSLNDLNSLLNICVLVVDIRRDIVICG